jgi:hypothetical protein
MMIVAKGVVYGTYWGGGEGSYPSSKLTFDTYVELVEYINSLKDFGCLDSGMGYQKVIGGVLFVTEEKVEDGWTCTRDLDPLEFGDLSYEQLDFCYEVA